jgi:hypothetical protein
MKHGPPSERFTAAPEPDWVETGRREPAFAVTGTLTFRVPKFGAETDIGSGAPGAATEIPCVATPLTVLPVFETFACTTW